MYLGFQFEKNSEMERIATLIYMPQSFKTSEALLLILGPHMMTSINEK